MQARGCICHIFVVDCFSYGCCFASNPHSRPQVRKLLEQDHSEAAELERERPVRISGWLGVGSIKAIGIVAGERCQIQKYFED